MIRAFQENDAEYLRDESRLTGTADAICFPASEEAISACLNQAYRENMTVTIQGARTGLTGGATPPRGLVLNLSRMNRMTGLRCDDSSGKWYLRVQPGVLQLDVLNALENRSFDTTGWSAMSLRAAENMHASAILFFPPDPTEKSASIGGMAACNASGARSFYYGAMRAHINALRVVLADGDVVALRRGEAAARGRSFELTTERGRRIAGMLPDYQPPRIKNAAGFCVRDDMDPVDLFIGSEGTLGIISEIELVLRPRPESICGILAFLPDESSAWLLVRALRGEPSNAISVRLEHKPSAIELINHSALDLLRRQKAGNEAFADLPDLPPRFQTGIYFEFDGTADEVEEALVASAEIIAQSGGNDEDAVVGDTPAGMERLKFIRHAVPESINMLIDARRKVEPALTKLGSDMAVPDDKLEWVMDMYSRGLAQMGLDSAIFGHIGDNHVHVNILPNTMQEYEHGKALFLEWARKIVPAGGTVSAEHGIGKLKRTLLEIMYGRHKIEQMKQLKLLFDPAGLLNTGNVFSCAGQS
ncbi:MAG: FAD-binding protein [Chitinivibrionales bacterium]|nr:FAD-binding protein [Chitinivibrionales bacterium]